MAYVAGLRPRPLGQPAPSAGVATVWPALVVAGIAVGLLWATLRIRPGPTEKLRG